MTIYMFVWNTANLWNRVENAQMNNYTQILKYHQRLLDIKDTARPYIARPQSHIQLASVLPIYSYILDF